MRKKSLYRNLMRQRWLFYTRSRNRDTYGEINQDSYTFFTSAYCGREKARNPIEVMDANAVMSEQQWVLRARWTNKLSQMTHDMVGYCPAKNLIVEIIGEPIDPDQGQMDILIYCVDNIKRDIDTDNLPRPI